MSKYLNKIYQYFFYRSFIEQESLSFSVLLSEFFHSDSKRFKECVIAANNTFGPGKVMEKLTPYLRSYLHEVYDDKSKILDLFLVFWFYLVEEALMYISKLVSQMIEVEPKQYIVEYKNKTFGHNRDEILEVLTDMLKIPLDEFDSALNVVYDYVDKNTSLLPELIYSLQSVVAIDENDGRTNFYRQQKLISFLTEKCADNGRLGVAIAVESSKVLLNFYFRHSKNFRANTITMYNIPYPLTPTAKSMRGSVLDMLSSMQPEYHTELIGVIQNYMNPVPGVQAELIAYDKDYLIQIIEKNFDPNRFIDSLLVNQVLNFWERNLPDQIKTLDEMRETYKSVFKNFRSPLCASSKLSSECLPIRSSRQNFLRFVRGLS